MTEMDELPERQQPPQKHYYEHSHEDILELLKRIKRDVELVEESDVYKRVGTAAFDLKDVIRILDHYHGRIVVEAFKTGLLKWHEPPALPGTVWPRL